MCKWLTYWFCIEDVDSDLCGEEFFVEAEDRIAANKTACVYFEEPHNCGEVTWEEADALGYDTY